MEAVDAVWGGLLAAGLAFEVYTLRNVRSGDTLSETTRKWFRVQTKPGKVIFSVLWVAFAAWFLVHIVG